MRQAALLVFAATVILTALAIFMVLAPHSVAATSVLYNQSTYPSSQYTIGYYNETGKTVIT